ncbi:hypothetical protein GGF46_002229 [Coemansia sp. RSA 552]|nr:hypothetical protein GGF46_002229 [Coemansia sp. RSA 552]
MRLTAILAALLLPQGHCLFKELVVSHHMCIDSEGCHIINQAVFQDSHVLLLASRTYQSKLQGRLVDIGADCSSAEESAGSGEVKQRGQNHQTIGLLQCGQCSLAAMLREAGRAGVGSIVIANTNECGRPTKDLLESATSVGVPVAFVASSVAKEIKTMQEAIAAESQPPGEHSDAFIYVSILDTAVESHVVSHILASTHILLATMAALALLIYLALACSVGSLRYIPREIAPEIFAPRPEPLGKDVLEKLPLVPVEWDISAGFDGDEEARYESPDIDPGHVQAALQQQLACIITRSGEGSYSFMEEQKCAICLDSYLHKESLRLLPCRHAFHRKCIDAWLLSESLTSHCPICKSSITDGLRLLDEHGYGEVLSLLSGRNQSIPSVPFKPTATTLPLYFYRIVCGRVSGLWRRRAP